jgi:uncharacterized lipoprotein
MQRVIKSLFLTVTLVSCSSDNANSRYQDLSHLEYPPTIASSTSNNAAESRYIADESRIEKRTHSTGLGEKVYLTNSDPQQLRIRFPIERAWYALAQAIKQSHLKITDYDREKKIYYVSTKEEESGWLSGIFSSGEPKVAYVLSMKGSGNETAVMANLATEQERTPETDPDKILRQLYEILHDELKLDYNGS